MRVLSAAMLAVVACAHVERHPTDVERRLAALEARADLERRAPAEEFYRSLRVPSGIFYASAPMSRINPPSFLLGQGAAVGEGGNCAEPSAACRAASFTTTGTSTALRFVSTATSGNGLSCAAGSTCISIADNQILATGASRNIQDTSNGWSTGGGWVTNSASGRFLSASTSAGNDAFAISVNGAFFHFGTGANDKASSDGTTVTFAGPIAAAGVTLSSTTSPLTFNTAPGTAGQVALSAGAGATPTWGTVDQTFCVYNTGALAGATAFGETTFTHAATVDTGSKIIQDVAGTGAGNFVVKVCTDGATCAGGNTYLTYTEACTAVAGVRTAATVQNSGAIAAGSTVTVSVSTACAPDPAANVCIHYTTP